MENVCTNLIIIAIETFEHGRKENEYGMHIGKIGNSCAGIMRSIDFIN